MAKDAVLTVKVNDEEFQKFIKNFNEFSDKLKDFGKQFKTSEIDNASKSARALTDSMRTLLDTSKGIHSSIRNVTSEFGKWSTLIGGTVMMLGGGAGMFGIDRLLNSFIQRQRTALGMGMTTGQGQAALGMEGLVPGSPEAIMRNIQGAKHGDLNKLYGAQAMGLDLSKSPEEIYKDFLRKFPSFIKGLPKGFELKTARDLKATEISGDEKVMEALRDPEAFGRELKEVEWREEHLPKLGPEETRKLEELKNSWNDFTSVVQTRLTQGVAAISPALTAIARSMTGAVPESTKDITRLLRHPLNYLEDKLTGDVAKNKIAEWGEFLKQYFTTPVSAFKTRMDELSQAIWDLFGRIGPLLKGQDGAFGGPPQPAAPTGIDRPPPGAPALPGGTAPPPGGAALPGTPGTRTAPPTTTIPGSVAPPNGPGQRSMFQFGGNQFASFGGNRSLSMAAFGGNRFASSSFTGGGSRFAFPGGGAGGGGGTRLAMTGGGGGGGGGGRQQFASAAQRSVPGPGGMSAMFNRQSQFIVGSLGGARGPGGRGGLDVDNWQHSRTSNLVVRDVPGSNIHMAATGMG